MIDSRLLRYWFNRIARPARYQKLKYQSFKKLLQLDTKALDTIAELDSHLYGHDPADKARIRFLCRQLSESVRGMAYNLLDMAPEHASIMPRLDSLINEIRALIAPLERNQAPPYIIPLEMAAGKPEIAGGKAANLATAKLAGVPVPPGFVITSSAFFRFIYENGLDKKTEKLFQTVRLSRQDIIIRITAEIQELILGAEVPDEIAAQIEEEAKNLVGNQSLLAVRSSALAEDGAISFAGQYASELDVAQSDVISAYKRVLAGKYCPRAVAYRVWHGLTDSATAMAVLVLPMMNAEAGGVVYTKDPEDRESENGTIGIYMVEGKPAELVDGSLTPERYVMTREEQPRIIHGKTQVESNALPEKETFNLGRISMFLEKLFGCPQDVEWTYGPEGISILQSRPLKEDMYGEEQPSISAQSASVLAERLTCASPGAACGHVHIEHKIKDFRRIPQGSVLVTDTLRPAMSQFIDRIAAIVAKNGSRASHFSSVARERGVPVVVGSSDNLVEGRIVTVDAAAGIIYDGCLPEIEEFQKKKDHESAQVRSEYSDLIKKTVQLHLVDPDKMDFSPENFSSLHDTVRFCHEKSVEAMFSLVGRQGRGLGRSRRLVTDLPIAMYVLDFGGGLDSKAGKKGTVIRDHIASTPLYALWNGLSDKRVPWDNQQLHVDWEQFDRISSGIFKIDSRILASYAVIASDYAHLNIRFGYHFSIVDSICSDNHGTNYIRFRFKGGGASLDKRGFRLVFISKVLEYFDFETSITGDMLDAFCSRLSRNETENALKALGLVLAITRVMDIKLSCIDDANMEAKSFMQRFFSERIKK